MRALVFSVLLFMASELHATLGGQAFKAKDAPHRTLQQCIGAKDAHSAAVFEVRVSAAQAPHSKIALNSPPVPNSALPLPWPESQPKKYQSPKP